jgi:subtilase family serine protease
MVATTVASVAPSPTGQRHSAKVCGAPAAGNAACRSLVPTDAAGKPTVTTTPAGLGPTSGGRTVAIVDAYNDPTAGADLADLPHYLMGVTGLPACTTACGCFQKMDQRGGRSYPSTNGGRAQEISLDLDMVSATCPDCHIPLVEAKSSSFANLGAAVNTAAKITGVTPPSTATAADMQPTPPTALTTTTGHRRDRVHR